MRWKSGRGERSDGGDMMKIKEGKATWWLPQTNANMYLSMYLCIHSKLMRMHQFVRKMNYTPICVYLLVP